MNDNNWDHPAFGPKIEVKEKKFKCPICYFSTDNQDVIEIHDAGMHINVNDLCIGLTLAFNRGKPLELTIQQKYNIEVMLESSYMALMYETEMRLYGGEI